MRYAVLALDVDGVLTDGGIYLDEGGTEWLRFSVRDGQGIVRWLASGRTCVWVSARASPAIVARASRLGVCDLLLGVKDKKKALEEFLSSRGYRWDDVVYIGDDLVDLEAVREAGLGVAVADAVPALKRAARYVTSAPGGRGAVREVVDMTMGEEVHESDETTETPQTSGGRPCGAGVGGRDPSAP